MGLDVHHKPSAELVFTRFIEAPRKIKVISVYRHTQDLGNGSDKKG